VALISSYLGTIAPGILDGLAAQLDLRPKVPIGVCLMGCSARTSLLAHCLFALTLLSPLGCNADGQPGGSGIAGSISGPLAMLPEYQARAPRTCATVNKPPSAAQATLLVQCTMDVVTPGGLGLVQDIQLEMGKSRQFVYQTDAGLAGIDLPLRGTYTMNNCHLIDNMNPVGKSCLRTVVQQAVGWCWKTSFGDYKCKMEGAPGGSVKTDVGPAPKAF
jgi:hypothetical protein